MMNTEALAARRQEALSPLLPQNPGNPVYVFPPSGAGHSGSSVWGQWPVQKERPTDLDIVRVVKKNQSWTAKVVKTDFIQKLLH